MLSTLFNLVLSLALTMFTPSPTTTVTATVVDTDAITWTNGSWSMTFKPNPSQPNIGVYNIGGQPLDPTVLNQKGSLGNTGALTALVYDNVNQITPAGSTWALTVCPNASAQCTTYQFTATGSSMDVSTAITSIITSPRFIAQNGAFGYADVEVINQLVPGSTYFNVLVPSQRTWTGSAWQNGGGGGGTITAPLNQTVVGTGSGTNAVPALLQDVNQAIGYTEPLGVISTINGGYANGDSVTVGIGVLPVGKIGWKDRLSDKLNTPAILNSNAANSGLSACDLAYLKPFQAIPQEYDQPFDANAVGTNDATHFGTDAAAQQAFFRCIYGLIIGEATPPSARFYTSTAPISVASMSYNIVTSGSYSIGEIGAIRANGVGYPNYVGLNHYYTASGFTANAELNGQTLQYYRGGSQQNQTTNIDTAYFHQNCATCVTATDAGTLTPADFTFGSGWTQDTTDYPLFGVAYCASGNCSLSTNKLQVGKNGNLYVRFLAFQTPATTTGTFNFQVNGVAQTGYITHTTTMVSNLAASNTIDFTTSAPIVAEVFTNQAPFSYPTITIQGLNTGPFAIVDIGSPHGVNDGGSTAPTVIHGGIPYQQGDAQSSTTALYDSWDLQGATQLNQFGWRVKPCDLRANMDFTQDMAQSDLPGLHPGPPGTQHEANRFSDCIQAPKLPPVLTLYNSASQIDVLKAPCAVFVTGGAPVILHAVQNFGACDIWNFSNSLASAISATGNSVANISLQPQCGIHVASSNGSSWFITGASPGKGCFPASWYSLGFNRISQLGGTVNVDCLNTFQDVTGGPPPSLVLPTTCPQGTTFILINESATNADVAISGQVYGDAPTVLHFGQYVQLTTKQYAGAGGFKITGGNLSSSSVGSGLLNAVPRYNAAGTAIQGSTTLSDDLTTLLYTGTGGISALKLTLTGPGTSQWQFQTLGTLASLGTCNGTSQGTEAIINDATSPTFLATATGGGSTITPVFCNGTNWLTY